MRIEIELSDLAAQMFGEDPALKIQACVEKEALRLWYIERSKPKERKPVGRPALNVEDRRLKELIGTLQTIYLKLQDQLGLDFATIHGESFARLEALIGAKDLKGLEAFVLEEPWIKKWRRR
jgi:hypothetical protein